MSFPRYPSYKRTAVVWMDEVPEHWTVTTLARVTRSKCDGPFGSGLKSEHYVNAGVRVIRLQNIKGTGFDSSNEAFIDEAYFREELSRHDVTAGDLLIAGLGDENNVVGRACVAPAGIEPALVKADCFRFRLDERRALAGFAALQLSASSVFDSALLSSGSTRSRIPLSVMGYRTLMLPPLMEQQRIVAFLDRETAKIDALVAEQRRLMELLKEKRQAVISQAVTKGLNPDVSMKDSHIEWLGDIPAHWEVVRLGSAYRETSDPGRDDLPILSVSIHHGVSDTEVGEEEMERKVIRIEDRTKYVRVAKDDLVYNMMRAWQGAFGTVEVDGMVSPAYVVARPRRPVVTAFVEKLLRTPQAIEEMRRHSQGVTDFRLRLYWDEFKNIRIALPSNDEARAICAHIAATEEAFETMAQESERLISLLIERRTALISAAVTGCIDVRDLNAGSPPG